MTLPHLVAHKVWLASCYQIRIMWGLESEVMKFHEGTVLQGFLNLYNREFFFLQVLYIVDITLSNPSRVCRVNKMRVSLWSWFLYWWINLIKIIQTIDPMLINVSSHFLTILLDSIHTSFYLQIPSQLRPMSFYNFFFVPFTLLPSIKAEWHMKKLPWTFWWLIIYFSMILFIWYLQYTFKKATSLV